MNKGFFVWIFKLSTSKPKCCVPVQDFMNRIFVAQGLLKASLMFVFSYTECGSPMCFIINQGSNLYVDSFFRPSSWLGKQREHGLKWWQQMEKRKTSRPVSRHDDGDHASRFPRLTNWSQNKNCLISGYDLSFHFYFIWRWTALISISVN